MNKLEKIIVVLILSSVICCKEETTPKSKSVIAIRKDSAPPLPPGYVKNLKDSFCDSLRSRSYQILSQGKVELVTTEYPANVDKKNLFKKVIMEKYGLNLLPVYDSAFYGECIIPIMDSVITSKHGYGAKRRIIEWANHYVDSVFMHSR